jgi:hypothetical protein
MIRTALALLLVSLVALAGGGQARPLSDAYVAVKVTGAGGGLMLNPTGTLDHSSNGYDVYRFAPGTAVTIGVSLSVPGTRFARWLYACSGSAPTCRLTANGSQKVIARLSPVRLYINPANGGDVTVSPAGPSCGEGCTAFPYASSVRLDAHACCGYVFSHWRGACATVSGSACLVSMFDTVETTPVFECAPSSDECVGTNTSPLSRDVPSTVFVYGSGHVQINGKDCRPAPHGCPFTFTRAQTISLRAFFDNSRSVGWSGACSGSAPRCQFSAFKVNGQSPNVTARFGS